jgi:pentafunctional AROM polypeptide
MTYLLHISQIGIAVEGVEVKHPSPSQGKFTPRAHDPAASIIIIGMRGAGKTFIGGFAADALGRQFIDADEYFQNKHSMLVSAFVKNYGWPAFREAELEVLKELLVSKSVGHVMSLGGGVVETPVARDLLKAYADERGPVVHVVRDTTEIVQYLGNETARPAYGEPLEDVLVRREPWFKAVSNYDFFSYSGALHRSSPNAAGPSTIPHISSEVTRFFRHITGQEPNLIQNPGSEKRSYFLTLTYANIADALPIIDEITEGVDAIELRVDLLSPSGSPVIPPNIPPPSYVAVQLAALRQSTSLPVVFTVRTVLQGGAFPDTAEREAFELAELAIRSGCEYIDVETTWDEKKIRALAAGKGESKIIASWHNWSGKVKWDSPDIRDRYKLAASLGDIVKIVSKATRLEDNFALHKFSSAVTSAPGAKPLIAINMGREGQLSRILNPTLSPVSHPLQPSKAAPGQVSFAEIQKALHLIGELPAKKFYLLGTPISHSPSPTLHNTGFETLGLPHRYSLLETTDVVKNEVVRNALMDPEFGGASVTIPHKLAIMQLLDSVSPHAEAIGAVNTVAVEITADGKRKLTGTNTDWLAIQESIRASLPQALWKRQGKKVTLYTEAAAQSDALHTTALVLGAGGTSRAALYALHDVGATQIYLFNRTKKNAQTLADAFPGYNIIPIDTLDKFPGQPPSIIISTVPASATTLSADKTDALYLQPSIFAASAGGVVIDMAYKPAETPLLSLSQSVENAAKWARVGGVDILLGQGYLQFELWTGRRAPRKTILEKVWERYQQI